jgi:hypothetical protein
MMDGVILCKTEKEKTVANSEWTPADLWVGQLVCMVTSGSRADPSRGAAAHPCCIRDLARL